MKVPNETVESRLTVKKSIKKAGVKKAMREMRVVNRVLEGVT